MCRCRPFVVQDTGAGNGVKQQRVEGGRFNGGVARGVTKKHIVTSTSNNTASYKRVVVCGCDEGGMQKAMHGMYDGRHVYRQRRTPRFVVFYSGEGEVEQTVACS